MNRLTERPNFHQIPSPNTYKKQLYNCDFPICRPSPGATPPWPSSPTTGGSSPTPQGRQSNSRLHVGRDFPFFYFFLFPPGVLSCPSPTRPNSTPARTTPTSSSFARGCTRCDHFPLSRINYHVYGNRSFYHEHFFCLDKSCVLLLICFLA